MTQPLLDVKDLKVDFLMDGEMVCAVHDVSFTLEKGQVLGIVGESGCGKSVTATSLLRLLPKLTSRIDSCSSVKLNGRELTSLNDKEFRQIRGKEISMIFQEPMTSLNPVQTVGMQIVEMIRAHGKVSKHEAWERGVEMLKKVGIPEAESRMKSYPHQLSGGMRQRMMIAIALSCDPSLLIADEPTTALDVTIQAQILELMLKLKEEMGTSILLITHDMGVVAEVTDYVLVMYAGEIVESGSVASIFKNPLHPYTEGLLQSIPRPDRTEHRLHTIDGTVPTLREMPTGCRFAKRCPFRTEKCESEAPSLSDVGDGRRVRCWRVSEIRR